MAGSFAFADSPFTSTKAGTAMKRLLVLVGVAALLAGPGCGGDQQKGINSNLDKPTAAPRPAPEPAKPAADSARETPPAGSPRGSQR
jgi:hypothetical protein